MTISVGANEEQDIRTGWEWLLESLAPPAYRWLLQQDLSPALLKELEKSTSTPPSGGALDRWRLEAKRKGYKGPWYISGPGIDAPLEDQPLRPGLRRVLQASTRQVRFGEHILTRPDPNAVFLLKFPRESLAGVEKELASHGVTNLKPLSGGFSSVVLDAGSRVVRLKIGEQRPRENIPEMLQPEAAGTTGGIGWEILPRVETENITEADVAAMEARLQEKGYTFSDPGPDNLGWYQGRHVVIDPGAVTQIGVPVAAGEELAENFERPPLTESPETTIPVSTQDAEYSSLSGPGPLGGPLSLESFTRPGASRPAVKERSEVALEPIPPTPVKRLRPSSASVETPAGLYDPYEFVSDRDVEYSKRYWDRFTSPEGGAFRTMRDSIMFATMEGGSGQVTFLLSGEKGISEEDRERASAYRVAAAQRGYEIGQFRRQPGSGVALASIQPRRPTAHESPVEDWEAGVAGAEARLSPGVVEKLGTLDIAPKKPKGPYEGQLLRRMGPRARPLPVDAMPGSPGYESMLSEYMAWGYPRPELRGILEQGGMTDVNAGDASDFLSKYFSDMYGGTPPEGITPAEWMLYPGGWQARARSRVQLPKGMEKPEPSKWTKEIGALMEEEGIVGDPSLMATRHQAEDYTRGELMASRQGMRGFFSTEAVVGTWPGIPGEEEGTIMLYKDPEDPAQRIDVAKSIQRGLVYPQVDLWRDGELLTKEGPRRVGPASTRPERGVVVPMVFLMEEWLPEGMEYLPLGFYTTATRRRVVNLFVPKGFEPKMEHKGRVWARGDEIKPFAGAAPVDLRLGKGWDRAAFMDYSLEPEIRTRVVGGKQVQEEGQRLQLVFRVAAGPETARLSTKSLMTKHMAPMADTERILGEEYAGYGVAQIKDPTMSPFSWWYAQPLEERAATLSDIRGRELTAEQVADIPWQQAGREVTEYFREKVVPDIYREVPLHFRVHESIYHRLLPKESLDKAEPVADVPEFWDIVTHPVPALVADWWMDVRKGWGMRHPTLPYRELRVLERAAPSVYKDVMKRAKPIMDAYKAIIGGAVSELPEGVEAITPTTEEVEKLFAMAEERASGAIVPESSLQYALLESAAEIWGTSPLKLGEQGFLAGPAHARRFTAEGVFAGEEVNPFAMAYAEALKALAGGKPEQVKQAFNRALIAQEKLAGARTFFRSMLSAHLGSRAIGDVIYGSDLLKPHEFTAPVNKVLRMHDLEPGTREANYFLSQWQADRIKPSLPIWGYPTTGEDPLRVEAVHPETMKKRAGKIGLLLSSRTPFQISSILAEAHGRDFDEDLMVKLGVGKVEFEYGPEQLTGAPRPIIGMTLKPPKDMPLATPLDILRMADQRLMAGRGSHTRGAFMKPPPHIDRATWEKMNPLQRMQATLDSQYLARADARTERESLNWMARVQSNIGKYFNLLEDVQVVASKMDPKAERGLRKAADMFFEIVHGRTQTPKLLPASLQKIMSRLGTGTERGGALQELEGEAGEWTSYKGNLPGLVGLRQKLVVAMMEAEIKEGIPERLREKAEEQWVDVVAKLAFLEPSYEEAKKAIAQFRQGVPGRRSTKWSRLAGPAEEWALGTPLGIVASAHVARRAQKREGLEFYGAGEDVERELLEWADLFTARRIILSKQQPIIQPVSLRNPADPHPDLPEVFSLQESEVGLLQRLRAEQRHPDDVQEVISHEPRERDLLGGPDTALATLNDDEVRLLDTMKATKTPSWKLTDLAARQPLTARSLAVAVERGEVPSYNYEGETEEERELRLAKEREMNLAQIRRKLEAQALVESVGRPARPREVTVEQNVPPTPLLPEAEPPTPPRRPIAPTDAEWEEEASRAFAAVEAKDEFTQTYGMTRREAGVPLPERPSPAPPRREAPAARDRPVRQGPPPESEAARATREAWHRFTAIVGKFSAANFEEALTTLEKRLKEEVAEPTLMPALAREGPLPRVVGTEVRKLQSLRDSVMKMAQYYAEEPGEMEIRISRAGEAAAWEGFPRIEERLKQETERVHRENLERIRGGAPEESPLRQWLMEQAQRPARGPGVIPTGMLLEHGFREDLPQRDLRAIAAARGEFLPGEVKRAYGEIEALLPSERKVARGRFAENLWPEEVGRAADSLTQRFRDLGLTVGEVKNVIGKYSEAQQAEVVRLGDLFRRGAPVGERAAGLERLGAYRRYFAEVGGIARDRAAGITTPEGFQVRVAGAQEALAGTLEGIQPPGLMARFAAAFTGDGKGWFGAEGPLRGPEQGFRYLTQYWNLMRMQRVWGMTGGAALGQIPVAAGEEQAAALAAMATMPMGQFQQAPMVTGLMTYAAQRQRFRGQVGRAAYGAWGWAQQGVTGRDLATLSGIGGPALGAGAVVGLGAQAIGQMIPAIAAAGGIPALSVGIPVAITAGAIGLARYGEEAQSDRERMAIAAARGPTGQGVTGWWDYHLAQVAQRPAPLRGGGGPPAMEAPRYAGLGEYGRQIATAPLAELQAPGRRAAIQEAVRVVTEEGGPLEWMPPQAVSQQLAEWYRVTPGAEDVPPEQILRDPRFAAMAMRGLGPETTYAKIAQQWGMAPSGWERIQAVTAKEPEAWLGTMMQYAPAARFGVTPEMVQERGWGPLEGQAQFQFQRLMAGDQTLWSQYAREGQAPAWAETRGPLGMPTGTRDLGALGRVTAARAMEQARRMPGRGVNLFTTAGGAAAWAGAPQALMSETGGVVPLMGGAEALIGTGGIWGLQDWGIAEQRRYENEMTTFQRSGLGLQWQYARGGGAYGRGTWAVQEDIREAQRGYQQAQFGLQARQIELQGTQFWERAGMQRAQFGVQAGWQLEDINRRFGRGTTQLDWRQADLFTGIARQRIGFGWQEQALGQGWDRTQAGLAWQEQALGRGWERGQAQFGWAAENLAYGRAQGALQFGWQMEDIDEAIRFATGRDRKRLITQRERAVTMYGMEEAQAGKEERRLDERRKWAEEDHETAMEQLKERRGWSKEDFDLAQDQLEQRRRWAEEDLSIQQDRLDQRRGWLTEDHDRELSRHGERVQWQLDLFGLEEKHHGENMGLALDRHGAAVAHFNEQIKLQDELIGLQETYWIALHDRQLVAISKAEEHRGIMKRVEDITLEASRQQELSQTALLTFWDEFLQALTDILEGLQDLNLQVRPSWR